MNDQAEIRVLGKTAAQRDDIAQLLADNLAPGNVERLGEQVLGRDAILDVTANRLAPLELARALVEKMEAADKLPDALAILKVEAVRNGSLIRQLNYIEEGGALKDFAGYQAIVQAGEDPFLDSDFLELVFPRVQRTVCAIGLYDGGLMGTGFLVGPDLVLTNHHVVDAYLAGSGDGIAIGIDPATGQPIPGSKICCFFDYMSPPRPLVPPDSARPHRSVVVHAAEKDWLIRARDKLPGDGRHPYPTSEQVGDRLDYAVIKLERPIGEEPSRRSGGAIRGWLDLSQHGNALGRDGLRLIVVQHPAGAQQLFDIGLYDQLDDSKTRIWYALNTEKGSSGSPAVDKEGRIYALHNASVWDPANRGPRLAAGNQRLKVNQGVRADFIAEDLKKRGFAPPPPPAQGVVAYWSLSDNVDDPRPIIGRRKFRQHVVQMAGATGERVLAVVGSNKGSGRRFSIDLLKHTVGTSVPIVHFKPSELTSLRPKDFVAVIADQLGISGTAAIPQPKETEPVARWVSNDLPAWLAATLAAGAAKAPSRYPAWIVVDTILDDGSRLVWQDGLRDLVSALIGEHDAGQQAIDIPQLRWLFLGPDLNMLPPTRSTRLIDDLGAPENTRFAVDFAECVMLAWSAIRISEPQSHAAWVGTAAAILRNVPGGQPVPAALAASVKVIVESGRTSAGVA